MVNQAAKPHTKMKSILNDGSRNELMRTNVARQWNFAMDHECRENRTSRGRRIPCSVIVAAITFFKTDFSY
jgi:hypothetical protein